MALLDEEEEEEEEDDEDDDDDEPEPDPDPDDSSFDRCASSNLRSDCAAASSPYSRPARQRPEGSERRNVWSIGGTSSNLRTSRRRGLFRGARGAA